jgi:cell division protein FtsZ
MAGAGSALMGIGTARGEDRAVEAAERAIASPLLEASIEGAHGVLLSVSGGSDLGLFEINEAARMVSDAAHPDANIIFGAVIDDTLADEVRVTVIAAGFDGGTPPARRGQPVTRKVADETPLAAAVAHAQSTSENPSIPVSPPPTPEPARPVQPPRTIVFDDTMGGDDLDVPDFLK